MSEADSFPLQRIFDVADLTPEGADVTVEATPEERVALAAFLELPAIHRLTGAFRLTGSERRVTVRGEVEATIVQVCTVSLEPFDTAVREDVEVVFEDPDVTPLDSRVRAAVRAADEKSAELREIETDLDAPDELVDGRIDLGALTAEFLALGLDPYPRKPGAEFSYDDGTAAAESPFAALSGIRRGPSGDKD